MSLLLDALKKAAQEKQQANTADGEDKQADTDELELSLEEQESVEQQTADDNAVAEDSSETTQPGPAEDELVLDTPVGLEKTSATPSTISDEALEMLVYKTNKQHRRNQKLVWGGTLAAAFLLLVLGGFYYYHVMVEEVEALERKHQIAMRQLEAQAVDTSQRKPIALPAYSGPVQKVVATKNVTQSATITPQKKSAPAPKQSAEVFTIQKTRKDDPVSALLNKGWRAYGDANYAVASDAYSRVLQREPNNRDGLLGAAAIAVKQGEYNKARAMYRQLLQLDPRDQIAVAAMSNLEQVSASNLGESKLKFMLQQQPDAPHLHFALGNYYAQRSKWPEAQREYFSAWQGSSDNPDYAFNLAVSLDQLGKPAEAKRFYEMSLSLSAGRNVSFSTEAVRGRLNRITNN